MTQRDLTGTAFQINGHGFFAHTAGDPDRPLLLFLHGFPEYCGAWDEVLPLLADAFYCVAPDQRGYGRSWKPEGVEDYATKHLVADVAAMIDHFGRGRAAALIGHDWGASVAYATAIRHPQKLAALIVANGVHPAPFQKALAAGGAQTAASQYITWLRGEGSEEALAKDDFARMMTLFSAKMDLGWMTPSRAQAYKAAWGDAAGVRAMVNWYRATPLLVAKPGQPIPSAKIPSWPVEALRISMPHLVLWGLGDTALLPEAREGLAEYCTDLEICETPAADHWITHQAPGFLAEHIRRFVTAKTGEA